MLDMNYFRAVQGAVNKYDEGSYKSAEAKENLLLQFKTSINYEPLAERNGTVQPLIITASEVKYKYNITAMPGDELYPGDIITLGDEHILVQQTRCINENYVYGLGWLCNLKLRFQNFDAKIHERYCVLDSGVYSTTVGQEDMIAYLKRQYNLWIPSDEDTDKIYIDKRLAVDTMYDQNGNIVLDAYKVTGRTKMAKGAYGEGTHLLSLALKSSEAVGGRDNIEEMICDYISADADDSGEETTTLLPCGISGRANLRLGLSNTYTPAFYDSDGNVVTVDGYAWDVIAPTGVTYKESDGKLILTAAKDDDLSGETVVIKLSDNDGLYEQATLNVGVF